MDPNGHIYRDLEEKIPAEDKARLEGYLLGRAEAVRLEVIDSEERLDDVIARAEADRKRLEILEKMTRERLEGRDDPNVPS